MNDNAIVVVRECAAALEDALKATGSDNLPELELLEFRRGFFLGFALGRGSQSGTKDPQER